MGAKQAAAQGSKSFNKS